MQNDSILDELFGDGGKRETPAPFGDGAPPPGMVVMPDGTTREPVQVTPELIAFLQERVREQAGVPTALPGNAPVPVPAAPATAKSVDGTDETLTTSGAEIVRPPREAVFLMPDELPDEEYVVPDSVKLLLRAVQKMRKSKNVVVGVTGPTGCGKTALAAFFAKRSKSPFFILDTPGLREPKELYGYKDVTTGEGGLFQMFWQESGFVEAIQEENAVILIDEANRLHPSILNTLLPLLDFRGRVWVDELGKYVRVAPGVVFFLTANIGHQYTGTWRWDAALQDRIQYPVEVTYLAPEEETALLVSRKGVPEDVARRMVEVAGVIRARALDEADEIDKGISTRQLLAAADLIATGVRPADALQLTLEAAYPATGGTTSPRAAVLGTIQGKFPPEKPKEKDSGDDA